MKTTKKISLGIICLAFLMACSKDDDYLGYPQQGKEPSPGEQPVALNVQFKEDRTWLENSGDNEISIEFSIAAPENGKVTVQITSNKIDLFSTVPAVSDNKLEIPFSKGDESLKFTFTPKDNNYLQGHNEVTFQIISVSENVTIGNKKLLKVDLLDDELAGKPKSWETLTGVWRYKSTLEYDIEGKVKKVDWERETPGFGSGTDIYFYNDQDQITRIQHQPGFDKFYYWENGRIVRTESIEQGIKKRFETYDYDESGKISKVFYYTLNLSGEYEVSPHVFDYFPDGNLKSQLKYRVGEDSQWHLKSQWTYGQYINKQNPFPMVELLPTVNLQQHLPGFVRIEENGHDLTYNLIYEYNEQGLVTRRSTSGETTTYSYY